MHNSKYAIAILTMLLLLITSVVSAQETTDIKANPDRVTVSPGQIFNVLLYVTPSTTIDTVAINLSMWDPALAEVTDITIGADGQTPLFEDQTVWIGGKEIHNDLGYLKHIVWGSTVSTSSPGYFATITFKAKKAGEFIFNIPPGQFDAARAGERIETNVISSSFSQQMPDVVQPGEKTGTNISFSTWQVIVGIAIAITIAIIGVAVIIMKRKSESRPTIPLDTNPNETTRIKVKKL
jgi:hypothetical protein